MSDQPRARDDFVGRTAELAALNAALAHTAAGRGRVVMLVGEAGIGKTRTAAEFAARAHAAGALVLRGACYEGEWAPPYGPFVEALTAYVRSADPAQLRNDLGFGAAPLTRLLPAIRERMPDVTEPVALPPDEERFRLFDAVSQFLLAIAKTWTVVVFVDDLHWADKGTIALLRHTARFAPEYRLLFVGTYRDDEVDATHLLADLLGILRRESTYERVLLKGLDREETAALITAVAGADVGDGVLADVHRRTQGNPFFVREVIQHLREEGRLTGPGVSLPELPVPAGIRHLVARRLARLSADAQRFLTAASGFEAPFRYDVAAAAAGLDIESGLAAIDAALRARLVAVTEQAEIYDFSHALIRHTLYTALNPARRMDLHRKLADTLERMSGDRPDAAAEIALQFHHSRTLPESERGVPFALQAAQRAEATAAWDSMARLLRVALDLTRPDDSQRARTMGRLGLAHAWAMDVEPAVDSARQAAALLAESEGNDAAADYLADVVMAVNDAGSTQGMWADLSRLGLMYAGARRDRTWALLRYIDIILREIEDPDYPGIPLDTPERRELTRVVGAMSVVPEHLEGAWVPDFHYNRSLLMAAYERARHAESIGRLGRAVLGWTRVFRCHTARGDFVEAQAARPRIIALRARLPETSFVHAHATAAEDDWRMARDEDWDQPMGGRGISDARNAKWYGATNQAAAARIHARMGRPEKAMRRLAAVVDAIERAPAWVENYVRVICDAAEALWFSQHTDFVVVIERNLRQKIIPAAIVYPMMDGSLALGRICALQKRYEEASTWFAGARTTLDEQGGQPLRAIVDYDEALMYARRGGDGDRERSLPLLEAALTQFRAIGMPGWIQRAEHLLATGTEWSPEQKSAVGSEQSAASADTLPHPDTQHPTPSTCLIRCDGDVWSISFAGNTQRVKDTRGLHYLAHLFAHPRREFHVRELASLGTAPVSSVARASAEQPTATDLGDAGEVLDSEATVQYQRRLTEAREELGEAEANNDVGRSARLREELEFLIAELASAGRGKRAASHVERARSAVGKRIRDAFRQISAVNPTLGRYLRATVKTGTFCSYTPDPRLRVEYEPYGE